MRYRTFLTLYFSLFFGLLGIATYSLFFYLSLIFEHNTYEEIARRQIKNDSIYGSAFNENFFSYRLKMVELQKPDILAIGSSRVGQFKAKYFNLPFYTAANSANDLFEMQKFIDRVLSFYTPKIVILGIDPWWFNPKYFAHSSSEIISGDSINLNKIRIIYQNLFNKKIPFSFNFLSSDRITVPFSQNEVLGIRAINEGYGSFVDGSYFLASLLYEFKKNIDIKFSRTLERINTSHSRFAYGQQLDLERIAMLHQIIRKLKDKNITTILFFTPVAHQIAQTMLEEFKEKYGYLFQLFTKAKELNIENFFDPSVLPNSSDCEFYDGFHGGDVTYARILLELAKKQPNFEQYLNLEVIYNTLKNKSGYAYSGEHFGDFRELDFLQIGCKK